MTVVTVVTAVTVAAVVVMVVVVLDVDLRQVRMRARRQELGATKMPTS